MDIKKTIINLILLILMITLSSVFVSAADCWSLTSESACATDSDCTWMSDGWGSWCTERGCWNYWNQTGCNSASVPNQTCQWTSGYSSSWCEEISCWSFEGTSESACETNSAGLNCTWEPVCDGGSNCWSVGSSEECLATTGCRWGSCESQGCWRYNSESGCNGKVGETGQPCTWNSQYNYCYELSCGDFANSTACGNANVTYGGLNCKWENSYCSEISCYNFDYTNQTYCENNPNNVTCTWSYPRCSSQECWNYNTQNSCFETEGCTWKSSTGSGWCEQVQCWSYDQSRGGTQGQCENTTLHNLDCVWDNGWCYQDYSNINCTTLPTEKQCMDSFYCWWDWSSSACSEPNWGGNSSIHTAWNPGCYIFDNNETACSYVNISNAGCEWDGTACSSNATIQVNGLNCETINNSGLCSSVTQLSTCCRWEGGEAGSCKTDYYSTACWDNMQTPPEGALFCGDYNAYTSQTLCNQIANDPWYMPCMWDNATERCGFDTGNVFSSGETQTLTAIDNQQACESAGGKWLIENYCDNLNNNWVSVPAGRCEYKFDEEKNCNKACFACEYKSDGGAWNTSLAVQTACKESKLGFCKFTSDSSAPNGYGYCDAKNEFESGVATDCKTDCGSCTFLGDVNASKKYTGNSKVYDSCNTPSCYCETSPASCTWGPDPIYPTDESKGSCLKKGEKTCIDRCDKCFDSTSCGQKGGGGNGTCSWDSAKLICKYQSGAEDMEICWDSEDNDGNGKMDCADSKCFSDTFCGGGFMTEGQNCFGYSDNATCVDSNCTWINETWNSWCDMPGAKCWGFDGDEISCGLDSNCEWHSGFGGFCENNWSQSDSCFDLNEIDCTTAGDSGCTWNVDTWCQDVGGWCEGGQTCPNYNSNSDCTTAGCSWVEDQWCATGGGGWCDHISFSCWNYRSLDACESINGTGYCNWTADSYSPDGGWCQSAGTTDCWAITNTEACSTASCEWISGFCDPVGFGGEMTGSVGGEASGGFGTSCYKYDGNQSGCQNQTGCGWSTESNAFCDVNFGTDCFQYSYDANTCNSYDKCTYVSEGAGGHCDQKAFVCQWNQSLNMDPTNCTAHPMCAWQAWGCEPVCFNQTLVQNDCLTYDNNGTIIELGAGPTLCKWTTGWCNPTMTTQMFTGMEMGAPVPLGQDAIGDATPPAIDIQGFGMKDMGDSYGFGISVDNFINASVCNGIKMYNNGLSGTGNQTTKFYVYLDTDGSTTGNCAMKNDATSGGYEFYLSYVSRWDTTTGTNKETFTSYKCVNSSWGVADLKLSSWALKMCNEIGGGMIAVTKDDLNKYKTLYNSNNDMRVVVVSANGTNNATSPSDTAVQGYVTPGVVDFEINDMFAYGVDMAKFGDLMYKGFIVYEDCYNNVDDNKDGLIDCNDYQCQYSSVCEGTGINAEGYSDTKSPKVKGIKVEEYPDGALIMYDTSKPANGTLLFYGNSSTCSSSTPIVVYSPELKSNNIRDYILYHSAELYSGTLNQTMYPGNISYYKLKACDSNNKCAISKCTGVTMASSAANCNYCDFVVRIKVPGGWNISYDVDQDGSYDHLQGAVCGPNAGMKINYTDARSVNVKLEKADGSTYMEFLNTRLSKTALNDKVRTVSSVSDFINGSTTDNAGATIEYAGMISETRDKLINNLHPEKCLMRIPSSNDELWHCDDSLSTCTNKTADAVINVSGVAYRVWELPYCEFSVWSNGDPATGSSGDGTTGGSSSSGGGTGGSVAGETNEVLSGEVVAGVEKVLKVNDLIKFKINKEIHTVTLTKIDTAKQQATVRIQSISKLVVINFGETKKVDLDDDGYYDLELILRDLSLLNVKLFVKWIGSVTEPLEYPETAEEEEAIEEPTGSVVEEVESRWEWPKISGTTYVISGLGLVVLVLVVLIIRELLKKPVKKKKK